MESKLRKVCLFLIVVFVGAFVFSSNVDAAYTNRVAKTYKYDLNIAANVKMNYHDYTYIYVADDARVYKENERVAGSGWNYVRYQVTKYYKNADMNW